MSSLEIFRDRHFKPAADFGPSQEPYQLLPFRFTRIGERECLVNECGEFLFVPTGTVRAIIGRSVQRNSELYSALCAKQFIADARYGTDTELLATKCRTKRSRALSPTQLHIFVVTLRCDHSCQYCQVSRQTAARSQFDMSEETARRAIDLAMESPATDLTLEFQGGEPTLALDRIAQMVTYARHRATSLGKRLRLVLTTNLAHLSPQLLGFLKTESVHVSTSLDGPAFIHNANRPRPGHNSFELATEGIRRCRQELGEGRVSALMTTTRLSLDHPEDIVDEYVRQELHSIFLRPLSPYGFALRTGAKTSYAADKFLDFYRRGLDRIIEINLSGYFLAEVYARLLLTKILTPFGIGYVDLQSPAGAGLGVLVYNYDGEVYLSDEGRMLADMGDFTMRIGNVHRHSRADLLKGDSFLKLFESWCNESLAGCSDCAFQCYCGADPIFNYATQGDAYGHRPTSEFCRRNMALIELFLTFFDSAGSDVRDVLWSWVAEPAIAANGASK